MKTTAKLLFNISRGVKKTMFCKKQKGGVMPAINTPYPVKSIPELKSSLQTLGMITATKQTPAKFDEQILIEDLIELDKALNTSSSLVHAQMCDVLARSLYRKGMETPPDQRMLITGNAPEHLRKSIRYKHFVDSKCLKKHDEEKKREMMKTLQSKKQSKSVDMKQPNQNTGSVAAETSVKTPSHESGSSSGSVASFISLSDPVHQRLSEMHKPNARNRKTILKHKSTNAQLARYNNIIKQSSASNEAFQDWRQEHAKGVAKANKEKIKPNAANMAESKRLEEAAKQRKKEQKVTQKVKFQ